MIHNRKVVALLPLKEHSERVSGKNFRDFCGKPLYHHIVQSLDHTFAVDELVIDTDSARVMQEGPRLSPKVRIIERPEAIRGDFVSMNRIIAHDISVAKADIYVQTHATNPLLRSETISEALRCFLDHEGSNDSLFSVTTFHSRFYFADGRPVNHDPSQLKRTQDLDPLYEENSCLYIFTSESFARHNRRIGETPFLFPTASFESIDIDDAFTFRVAELLGMYTAGADGK